jgi:hypothetical protein
MIDFVSFADFTARIIDTCTFQDIQSDNPVLDIVAGATTDGPPADIRNSIFANIVVNNVLGAAVFTQFFDVNFTSTLFIS